jgi:Tol biopolymer transport system component/DNA-binding winged helix-turn-helix (wHTH) protein
MANGNGHSIYEFDHFRLDAANLMLYRGESEIPLPPKVIKTLAVLVEHSGEILSKDDLMNRVWSDSVVEESNLSQYLYLIRKTLGGSPDGKSYIETLRRRGYRFNGEVRQVAPRADGNGNRRPASTASGEVTVERQGNVLRLVERAPQPFEKPEAEEVQVAASLAKIDSPDGRMRMAAIVLAFLAVAAAVGLTAFVYYQRSANSAVALNGGEITISRLTNGAFPIEASLSRDGKYFVYTETAGENSQMWLQAVGQSNRIRIAETADKVFGLKTFSPDGRFIYYAASDKQNPGSTDTYRMPIMGGPAVKILENVAVTVSFSPDGKEMAFYRSDPSGTSSLMIADSDGQNQRSVLTRRSPVSLAGSPAWSPDGATIIFSELGPGGSGYSDRVRINALELSSGNVRDASIENWDTVYRTEWTRDGRGFILIGTRANESYTTRRDQVYFISYPDGVSRRITTDGVRHEPGSLGVSDDGAVLALVGNRSSQVWTVATDGDSTKAEQISRGLYDGRAGLAPMPDGRVGFITYTSDDLAVWSMSSKGSDMIQLTGSPLVVEELRGDPRGRYFVFSAMKDRHNHLYRIDADGNNLKQLTFGNGYEIDSSVSPDGNSIAYASLSEDKPGDANRLYTSTIDGENRALFGDNQCSRPSYSSDGKYLACVTDDDKQVLIVSATNGSRSGIIEIPAFSTVNFGVRWTPDSSGVVFIRSDNACSNLWVQPLNGDKPRQLTNFTSGTIFRFEYAPDGSRIFLARGYPVQDVVLIKDFR